MNCTRIGWTDLSANPLKYRRKSDGKVVWGCVKTSPGCAHCYSEAIALRFERGKIFNAKNMEELEPFLDEAELREMLSRKTCGDARVDGSRCFVGDMTDLFGEWVTDDLLDRLFAVFALRPQVVWQVLTKRAGRMRAYASGPDLVDRIDDACGSFVDGCRFHGGLPPWPLPNVWLGVSMEDQKRADERYPLLRQTPAAVRFISAEPLLGPISLASYWGLFEVADGHWGQDTQGYGGRGIHWVIIGGESGPNRRPMEVDWVRLLVEQCRDARVACYVKQDAGPRPGMQGRLPAELWAAKGFPR
jgi:protein gp37